MTVVLQLRRTDIIVVCCWTVFFADHAVRAIPRCITWCGPVRATTQPFMATLGGSVMSNS